MKKINSYVIIAITICSFACSTQPTKDLRQPSSLVEVAKDFSRVKFFDESTINSSEVRYKEYNLSKDEDLNYLEGALNSFLSEYERRKDSKIESEIKQYVISNEVERPYNEFKFTDSSLKDAAKHILKMLLQIRAGDRPLEAKIQIAQIARAIQQKYTPPLKTSFELLKAPIYLVQYFRHLE